MTNVNILFFADRLPPLTGGMEVHAKYFIEYFTNHNKFPIIGIITKNIEKQDCIVLQDKTSLININNLSKFFNPQIIFFNSGRWVEELKQIRNIFPSTKFIYRTGGNEILKAPLIKNKIPDHKMRQLYWVQAINNSIDILITNSAYTEERLRKTGIKITFKRFVGGVNISALQNTNHKKNNVTTIFCAARFVPYKNHSLMISLINELVLRRYKFKVRFAGDGPLLKETKQQVKNYGLDLVIDFLGELNNSAACKEISNADIYMQLSKDQITEVTGGSYIHSEGMGRSILEAIASGTFVIAGKSGALSEIVKSKQGLLLELDDIKKMADKVEQIIKYPPAKRVIQTKFDWSKIFMGYEKLFANT